MNGSFRPAARLLAAVLSLLIVGNIVLMAQTAASQSTRSVGASSLPIGQNLEFLENKGQVRDEQGRPVDAVRFTAHSNSSKLFFMPDRIAHVFYTIEGPAARYEPGKGVSSKELDQTRLRYQRVDMELVGANKNVNLRAEGLLPGVTNFFTASAGPDGITGVRSFSTIIYENVYPNIDLVLKVRGKGMKAEFIVRPGGDPSLIKLRYTGAERIDATADGGYRIVTNLGTMTEDAPTPSFVLQPAKNKNLPSVSVLMVKRYRSMCHPMIARRRSLSTPTATGEPCTVEIKKIKSPVWQRSGALLQVGQRRTSTFAALLRGDLSCGCCKSGYLWGWYL